MLLLQEGLIYKDERLWRDLSKPYLLGITNGAWDPAISRSEAIFGVESYDFRWPIEQTDISISWNSSTNKDEVVISLELTPITDIYTNGFFVVHGGQTTSNWDVIFTGFNSFTMDGPTNPFSIGDRILYGGNFYNVTGVSGLNVLVLSSYSLPPSGGGKVKDCSGTLLVGVRLNNFYLLKSGVVANILLQGGTK